MARSIIDVFKLPFSQDEYITVSIKKTNIKKPYFPAVTFQLL